MRYFLITIEVAGLDCRAEDEGPAVAGFFTNRVARGIDVREAFLDAKRRLLAEPKIMDLIKRSRNNGAGEPGVTLTEAHEISFLKYLFTRKRQGLALYPKDAETNG